MNNEVTSITPKTVVDQPLRPQQVNSVNTQGSSYPNASIEIKDNISNIVKTLVNSPSTVDNEARLEIVREAMKRGEYITDYSNVAENILMENG